MKTQTKVIAPGTIKNSTKTLTHVAICLDKSGSMVGLRHDARNMFNEITQTFKKEMIGAGLDATFTLIQFDHGLRIEPSTNLVDLQPLTPNQYIPSGGTALLDAVVEAANRLSLEEQGPNIANLILVFTDGHEESSKKYRPDTFKQKIKEFEATGRFTFAFNVPPGGAKTAAAYGISPDNIREWAANKQGAMDTVTANNVALANYAAARTQGVTKSVAVYATTNASKVTTRELRDLDIVTHKFKQLIPPKEMEIKELVEKKGYKYKLGSAYYLLLKNEEVQANKQMLIRKKGENTIYGGDKVRELLGIPAGKLVKVTPGNHSDYDVFVQSGSINRKVSRETKVLLDVTLSKEIVGTW